jgi:tetratricopeptide (TPR) repeat protein
MLKKVLNRFRGSFFCLLALVSAALAGGAELPAPIEIPYPDMTGLEEAVQEQINAAHGDLVGWQTTEDAPAAELANAYGRLGQLLHAYSLTESAEAAYRNAQQLAPEELRWTYLLGVLAQTAGRLEDAANLFHAVLRKQPEDVAARVHLGEVLLAANQADAAAVELGKVLQLAPREPTAHASLGEIALSRKDYKAAAEHLATALRLVPAADRLHYPLAMALRGLGQMDEARSHLARSGSVGVKVNDPLIQEIETLATGERVHLLRGRQAFAAGRYAEAAGAFREALAADPRSARALVNLGSALGQMGDVPAALVEYRKALGITPNNFAAHLNLGLLYAHQGWDDEAVVHLKAAINLRYTDAEAHLQLARVLARQAKGDTAKDDTAKDDTAKDDEAKREEALEHFREAVAMAPTVPANTLALASYQVDLGLLGDALATLEEGVRLMPHEGQLNYALAQFLVRAPDKSLRDPARGAVLARQRFEAKQDADFALLVAEALAQIDRCSEAAEWQGALVRAAEAAGKDAAALRRDLERYAAGPPCLGNSGLGNS